MKRTWMKRCAFLLSNLSLSERVADGICVHYRLQGCQPNVEVWQRILQVLTLMLSPDDDPVMWIKFANLRRKNDRMPLAEKTINSLLSPERVRCSFSIYRRT